MPAEDLALPTLDLRALARRAAVPVAAAAAVVAALLVLGGPLHTFTDAVRRALAADPVWVGAAAAFELLSFAGYIALLWLVGSRVSKRIGLRESAEITLGGAAATRLLPTAGAGGAAMTLWALRRSGMAHPPRRGHAADLPRDRLRRLPRLARAVRRRADAERGRPARADRAAGRPCRARDRAGAGRGGVDARRGHRPPAHRGRRAGRRGARRDRARPLGRPAPARRASPGGRSTWPCCTGC